MRISEKLLKAVNEQIQMEIYSEYIYLSMAAYCEYKGYDGCASWFRLQAEEERYHAMKFFNFIREVGGRVELLEIKKPPFDFDSIKDAFEAALDHEKKVSASIKNLTKIAREEEDYNAESILRWFNDEQVEEESSVEEILDKLEMINEQGSGLYMIDKELGQRAYNKPDPYSYKGYLDEGGE